MAEDEIADLARPVVRFLGHSLAAVLGFCVLGLILTLPILFLHLLTWANFDDLAKELRPFEKGLFYIDLILFSLVFLIGAIEFVILEILAARRTIKAKL